MKDEGRGTSDVNVHLASSFRPSYSIMNKTIIQRFEALLKANRLAHAYLFVGPEGIGKFETALVVAGLVIGGEDEITMKRVLAGNHPDVTVVDLLEDESTLGIDQIRELISRMQLRPFEGARKVCIIKNIEDLTTEAGNALLKTLEEPTPNTMLILTTAVPEKNLGTIRSRCHAVHFFPMSKDKLAGQLKSDYAMEESATRFLTLFSEGNPGKAKRLKEANFLVRKNQLIDNIILQPNSDAFLKTLLADKDKTKEMLDVLLSWFRDVILVKTGNAESRLVHADRVREIQQAAARYTFDEVQSIIGQIVKTTQLLGENLNVKIPVSLLRERIWVRSSRSS